MVGSALYGSGAQNVVPGPAGSPGNLLHMQIYWALPGPSKSATLGGGAQ